MAKKTATDRKASSQEHQHAQQERRADGGILIGQMLPPPFDPGEGLINRAGAQAEQRRTEGGLISKRFAMYWVQKKLARASTSRATAAAGQLYPPRYPGLTGLR